MSFFNTAQLKGVALRDALQRARRQNDKVLTLLESTDEALPPHVVHERLVAAGALRPNVPLTSVRRSLTTLERSGLLEKGSQVPGPLGIRVHTWRRKWELET